MKKYLFFILLATLLLSLALTACGNEADTSTLDSTSAPTSDSTSATTTAPETQNPVLVTAYDDPEAFATLPALKDIQVSNQEIKKRVDADVASILKKLGYAPFTALPEGTAAIKGNAVNIHYVGRAKDPSVTLSEATLQGMTNATDVLGYDLVLGSGSFIPGFEDQLIGAKKGDKIDVDVTFPKDYSPELSEVAVIFEVTVNEVKSAFVSDKNAVGIYVSYALNGVEANGDIATFLDRHGVRLDMAALTEKFDDYFDATIIANAIRGKGMLEEIKVDLTLTAEQAKEFGYETELSLTATLVIADIVAYPEELTNADTEYYTGGQYKTAESFLEYLTDYYRISVAYETVMEKITFKEIPSEVYAILYQSYYDASIRNQVGSGTVTDAVKEKADAYAKENATAEWEDRMLVAYLKKILNFTLTDELYQAELNELYDYHKEYNKDALAYYGINSAADLEAYFGKDYLVEQFSNDLLLETLAEKLTYVD